MNAIQMVCAASIASLAVYLAAFKNAPKWAALTAVVSGLVWWGASSLPGSL